MNQILGSLSFNNTSIYTAIFYIILYEIIIHVKTHITLDYY